jgi:tetratricopeptide (TPR) repeat protein
MNSTVKVWEEEVIIPTYGTGNPEKNPIFLEKRVYQGSSGVVYPHPVIEKILDEKTDKTYKAVFIENEYLKIMVLPELGGRVQMAWDKVQQRHFIYYNQVIKPALVGLTGPWISGGIEFNWPQHHRPSTFQPVDYTIEHNNDGSKTIWINEVELMFRTKGMAGFTLYPGKAYLEIKGRLYNRTPFPQTFLWWANPAVKVNDDYQSVFPPDVHAVFDHGKRDVSSFPFATGKYYNVDYSPGTDISRYKNIPVPTSYMAIQSQYDFMGGYEHDSKAGLLHVADHHFSPGKKQWTWGNGDFGQAWDRNLTDEDGPYIELMTGIFTDNQPDFSWLHPQEEKIFTQYFLPYSKVGMVKNATKEAIVNLETKDGEATIKVYSTAVYKNATIILQNANTTLFKTITDISPCQVYEQVIPMQSHDLKDAKVTVTDERGNVLVTYQSKEKIKKEIPIPAQAAKVPQNIATNELLYLNGLHIEQYRHATFSAVYYYEEALRRDDSDIRNNNALGLWYLKRGQFLKAEPYFRKAIQTLTVRNPNPCDGEPFYNLGWCLKMQGRLDEAYDAFYKSTWNDACKHQAFFALASIASSKKNYDEALKFTDQSLVKNWHSHSVRHLQSAILRINNMEDRARRLIEESIAIDPFNYGCRFEHYLLLQKINDTDNASLVLNELKKLMRDHVHNYIEYALDYAHAGLYEEAIQLLNIFAGDKKAVYPMVYYYLGYFYVQLLQEEAALRYFKEAGAMSSDYCFPHRIEDIGVLETAMKMNPEDAKAPYYLGNFWYDKRQYNEAIFNWEKAAASDDLFPTVHRNLSLAYHNKTGDATKALEYLEKAFYLNTSDARVLMELDQLYKKMNRPLKERLSILEQYPALVNDRDDLYLEKITLLNLLGKYEKAKELLAARHFHPWEGGEGKVAGQFLVAHTELAKKALFQGKYQTALELLNHTEKYPPNLGEGKLYATQENDINYLQGCAYAGMGLKSNAVTSFKKATVGISEPVQAIFYNDPQPDKIFYQGLAWIRLDAPQKANDIFDRLIQFGNEHIKDKIQIDYFAVSLPDLLVFDQDLNLKNKLHCCYLIGLGYLGLREYKKAKKYFNRVVSADAGHQGVKVHLNMIDYLSNPKSFFLDDFIPACK